MVTTMRSLIAMTVVVAACSHAAPAPTAPAEPDADERAIAEANVAWFADKVEETCACTEASCATAAQLALTAWMPAHFGEARIDEAQRQRMRDSMARLGACLAPKQPASDAAQAIIEMRAIETRMCACADLACVKRVSDDFEALGTKHADTKASESEIKEAAAVVGHITECATRAVMP